MAQSFIGAGWDYPARIDATGSVALVAQEGNIEKAIRLILGTAPGERPRRPEFGCRIHDFVFGPVSSTTAAQMVYAVRAALERWEPRVDLTDVRVGLDDLNPATIYLDIRYTVKGHNDPHNLVFPFYVIPDELDAATPLAELAASTGGE